MFRVTYPRYQEVNGEYHDVSTDHGRVAHRSYSVCRRSKCAGEWSQPSAARASGLDLFPAAAGVQSVHPLRPTRVAIDIEARPALTGNEDPFFNQSFPGVPLLTVTSLQTSSLPNVLGLYELDFNPYRYLTPTPANERLTSIRATYPKAAVG